MKIALLGYGKEGQATKNYFSEHFKDVSFDIFENLTPDEIKQKDYSSYDYIFRSPSIPPLKLKNESSITKYFFDHCPCPIIGVTASKGKGTTCSFIKSLLDILGKDAYLVGNIGVPAIDVLDSLSKDSVVVYEMSSFQLWDLEKSPHIAVLGMLEPEHLNVHKDFQDYLNAKTNIFRHQTEHDYLIYYKDNEFTTRLIETAKSQKIPFPFTLPDNISSEIKLPGEHNLSNATAAIAAVASLLNISPNEFLSKFSAEIKASFRNFTGLPHRLEFLRELNGVKYFDDNFSTTPTSLSVAIKSFPNENLIVIVGGRDKTKNLDLPEIYKSLSDSTNVKKIILIGESGHALYQKYKDSHFLLAEDLEEAIKIAKTAAEECAPSILLMSPAAASFDMFENVYDRGAKFQAIVNALS